MAGDNRSSGRQRPDPIAVGARGASIKRTRQIAAVLSRAEGDERASDDLREKARLQRGNLEKLAALFGRKSEIEDQLWALNGPFDDADVDAIEQTMRRQGLSVDAAIEARFVATAGEALASAAATLDQPEYRRSATRVIEGREHFLNLRSVLQMAAVECGVCGLQSELRREDRRLQQLWLSRDAVDDVTAGEGACAPDTATAPLPREGNHYENRLDVLDDVLKQTWADIIRLDRILPWFWALSASGVAALLLRRSLAGDVFAAWIGAALVALTCGCVLSMIRDQRRRQLANWSADALSRGLSWRGAFPDRNFAERHSQS